MDIRKLTTEEKAALVSGTNFMFTNSIPRLEIPSVRMSDGPHGLRVQNGNGDNGISRSEPATAFPTAACVASSWNTDNAYRIGRAIAEECLYYGINVLLGPSANIKRNPLCGRNFEYFSEDPLISGKMAAAQIRGIQSMGVAACLKHFALNNSENYRFMGDSVCDMRAMREIYLKPFEIAVKKSSPYAMMCAYNQINGVYCSQNQWLLTEILRNEWEFDGLVMTDWGAMHDRPESLRAGLDLEMPGDTAFCRKQILTDIKSGALRSQSLDAATENVLRLVSRSTKKEKGNANFKEHHALSAEIAADSAVLLKNDGILPLDEAEKFCVIGDLFANMRYQGSGSSMIQPTELVTPKDAFESRGIAFEFSRGYSAKTPISDNSLIQEAVSCSNRYKSILLFVGLTDSSESEGQDRTHMRLPENQLALINALIKTGKRIAVVLFGGAPVELPFFDGVSAILNMYLPGQNGGTATTKLLFGDISPSGRLAETWTMQYEDVPFSDSFGVSQREIYRESIYVGYRYYTKVKKQVRFPFGFGLSYIAFGYSDLNIEEHENQFNVSCMISNQGLRDGAEVVQLYVKSPSGVLKPEKTLKGFTKVYLRAGEQKRVEMAVMKDDLCIWDPQTDKWRLERGIYEFQICSDCLTVNLRESIDIEGTEEVLYSETVRSVYKNADFEILTDDIFEELLGKKIPELPPARPITMESRFTDLQQTFLGRVLFRAVLHLAKKERKKAEKLPEGPERENKIKGAVFLKRILESSSLTTMTMSAGKRMPYNIAQGLMHLSNGKILKGIACFCKKIKVPKLPEENKK